MKKFCKVMLSVSLILFLLGVGIGVGTFIIVTETTLTDVSDNIGSCSYSFEGYDIDAVKVCNTYGNVCFVEGDIWSVQLNDVYVPMADAYCSEGELLVLLNTPVDITVCEWNIGVMPDYDMNHCPEIVITFPKNAQVSSIDIQSAVGNIDFADISTGYMVAQTAIGHIDASCAYVTYSGAMQTIIGKIETGNNFVIDTSYKFRLW